LANVSKNDSRYDLLDTKESREELEVYLNWIDQNKLPDSELSFINFVIGRGGFQDGRHLFQVWNKVNERLKISANERLTYMRFFMNPLQVDFSNEENAGWFNMLPVLYDALNKVKYKELSAPVFTLPINS